jgi:hypothetical protein
MAGKETGYTHARFYVEMGNMIGAGRDVLGPALEHRHAGLVRVQAGTQQMRHSAELITALHDLVAEGNAIRDKYDARMRQQGQAQAAAGGLDEVYGDKRAYRH